MENEKFIAPENLLDWDDGLSAKSNHIPEPTSVNIQHSATKNYCDYYIPPFTRHSNGCGQSAMATILTYWNRMQCNPQNAENLYSNTNSKPDIFGGILGTSWERFKQVMESYSMIAYGQNEPILTANSSRGKLDTLRSWANQGYPVAVILGNGELNRGSGAHWGIVVQVTHYSVELANYGKGCISVNLYDFMKAWEAFWLPGVHYAAVLAHPR